MPKVRTAENNSTSTDEIPQLGEQTEETTDQTVSLEYDHDTEKNTVSFSLSNGTEIIVREPKAIDFLRVKGWRDSAPTDDQSAQMMGYKLVSLCATHFKTPKDKKSRSGVSVYELIDQFETQNDLLMAANCLDFFRDKIERLSGRSDDIQLQQQGIQPEDAS